MSRVPACMEVMVSSHAWRCAHIGYIVAIFWSSYMIIRVGTMTMTMTTTTTRLLLWSRLDRQI